MKPKTCKACRLKFEPVKPMQTVCGPACALNLAATKREKSRQASELNERKSDRVNRERLKSRSDWMREAQASVNAYVRLRDAHLPCISCGRMHDGQWHAGHYRSRGSAPHLALDERNIHRQCAPCNTHLSGNLIAYRAGLIDRVGIEAVEALESDQEQKHYSIDDLKAIKKEYAAMAGALRKSQT